MHASTHRAITEAVAERLGIGQPERRILTEAATAPDVAPDYQAQPYLTRTGRLRVREVRVRHHGTPSGLMKSLAVKARHLFLSSLKTKPEAEAGFLRRLLGRTRERLARKAARTAGRLLHYIQDNAVPSPSADRAAHDSVERACERMDPRPFAGGPCPVGKIQTLSEIESVSPSADAEKAMEGAVAHSYRILGSVLGPPSPPEELAKKAREAYGYFTSRWARFLLYPIIAILLLTIPNAIFRSNLAPLAPLPFLFLLLLATPLVEPMWMDTALKSCQKLHPAVKWGVAFEVLLASADYALGVIPATALSAAVLLVAFWALLLRHPSWKVVRPEADWFLWG
jgi:hypothetical protein